jgi:hypothetical protein
MADECYEAEIAELRAEVERLKAKRPLFACRVCGDRYPSYDPCCVAGVVHVWEAIPSSALSEGVARQAAEHRQTFAYDATPCDMNSGSSAICSRGTRGCPLVHAHDPSRAKPDPQGPSEALPGPCGERFEIVDPAMREIFFCSLRAGHAGMHETKEGVAFTNAQSPDTPSSSDEGKGTP